MALALSAFPASALAGDGGGATAPTGPATDAGGSSYRDGFVPPPKPKAKPPAPKRRPAARKRSITPAQESLHRFPLAGPFDFGGDDARFGAKRSGHRHQGQDLSAPAGTPVVAPHGGIIQAVQYQRRGAGHYVVLRGDGEGRDYVFMHLRSGSIPVRAGWHVRTGELIGEVGNTGRSFGAHLHFEIWVGGWYVKGGVPIDPLPLLQSWQA